MWTTTPHMSTLRINPCQFASIKRPIIGAISRQAVDHRAVARRTNDPVADDHHLDRRHRVRRIVRNVPQNLCANFLHQLQTIVNPFLNTNLGHRGPNAADETQRPILHDQKKND